MSTNRPATVWIVADTHFGSQPRDRLRATGMSAFELERKMMTAWREVIAPADLVWHLGDVGDFQQLLDLPGVKHLVWGNGETRSSALASNAFATVVKRSEIEGIEMVHDPKDARSTGPVFHGHLHEGNYGKQGYVCLSVDQTGFKPIALAAAKDRLALAWNEAADTPA